MAERDYTQTGIIPTDDIVARLREEVMWVRHKTKTKIVPDPLCSEAADEIQDLREKLQDARMYLEQDACEIERLYAEINELRMQVVKLSLPQELPHD